MSETMWTQFSIFTGFIVLGVLCQFEWQIKDAYDQVKYQMDKVMDDTCQILKLNDLFLPEDSLSHLPDVKEVNINPVFPNRTALLHLHNLALSRSFFYSYILQARFIRPAINDTYDPGMMYYFLATVADVAANPYLNASSIYFAPNSSYSPSYRGFFNKTLPRFAPRTFRADDFSDPVHIQKISTLNMFMVSDLGAFSNESLSKDYTTDYYKVNEWYKAWLPDDVVGRHDTKTTYQVEIRYANNTNETFTFHGPPGADEDPGPIKWLRPYFDCERSNKWLVSASVPIADIYPRHTGFRHIEYPTYTAVAVLEMDFERIDINQCPKGQGNSGPNKLADTARCRKETTECEPIHGWGFRRGGYQCRCKPGWRLPNFIRRPYLGEVLERANEEQYHEAFDCLKIGWIHKMPIKWDKAQPEVRRQYLNMFDEYKNVTNATGPESLHQSRINVDEVLKFIFGVKPTNCHTYKDADLKLPGSAGYGAKKFFENEARMAVRLANFISAFLQVSDPTEVFSGTRVADKPLTEDQMFGETLALVLGDSKIWSAGTFWERGKFTNRTLFAPFAYKTQLNTRKFNMEDVARLNKSDEVYTNKEWFEILKQRWATNFEALEKHYIRLTVRNNETGLFHVKYERFPTSYRAARLEDGFWTNPYFDCRGKVKKWLITYAVPFFGWDSIKYKLEFKGVVAVSVDLLQLDINQCPQERHVPNLFKDTHKCDRRSSFCVPILGRGFETGGYKCECIQGYEYPFEDLITYYDGQLVEAEFGNVVADNLTRYHLLKCRLAGACSLESSLTIILSLLFLSWFMR